MPEYRRSHMHLHTVDLKSRLSKSKMSDFASRDGKNLSECILLLYLTTILKDIGILLKHY